MKRPPARPTFFWQGSLILLPLLILVGFGLWTARHDRLYAEQEEKRRAEVYAQLFAQGLATHLYESLRDNHWAFISAWQSDDLSHHTNKVVLTAAKVHVPAVFFNEAFDPPTRNHIGIYSDSPLRIEAAGSLCAQEGEVLAPLWRAAVHQPVEIGNPFEPIAHLRQAGKYSDARQKLELLVTRTNIQTASGIPVSTTANLLLAEISMEEKGTNASANARQLLNKACQEALILVTDFTPTLLDRATDLQQSWFPNEKPAPIWREQWKARENLAAMVAPVRFRIEKNPDDPKAFWIEREGVPWLVFSTPIAKAAELHLPSRADVSLFPEALVQEAVFDVLLRAEHALPNYEGIRVSLAGRDLLFMTNKVDSPTEVPKAVDQPQKTTELARTEVTWLGHDQSPGLPGLVVAIHVSDPAQWSRMMQKRQWWLIALIVTAGLASIVGFASARKAFQLQQRLNEAQSNFVSSVSHELRAPIASVRLMAESLERDKISDPARKQEYFRYIVQECRRLSTLIENVLDLSRIDQDRKNYVFEACDFRMMVEQTVQLMTPYAAEKGVTLSSRIAAEIPTENAFADGHALQQALINLIDNAIKHSPRQGEVMVDLSCLNMPKMNSTAQISVTDQGPGIPASEQTRIFEKFYRLGSELRRETEGIGIGLSIVKHVVEAHGGKVLVKSTPGEGSRFTMEVPLQPPSERKN